MNKLFNFVGSSRKASIAAIISSLVIFSTNASAQDLSGCTIQASDNYLLCPAIAENKGNIVGCKLVLTDGTPSCKTSNKIPSKLLAFDRTTGQVIVLGSSGKLGKAVNQSLNKSATKKNIRSLARQAHGNLIRRAGIFGAIGRFFGIGQSTTSVDEGLYQNSEGDFVPGHTEVTVTFVFGFRVHSGERVVFD